MTRPGRALGLGVVAAAAAISLFAGLGAADLYDPHESSYAATALEMRRTGDWITPRLNGAPNHDKPPLYFWLAQACFAALGETVLAARLPNALAAAANVALAYAIGARLFRPLAGIAAALVLATSFGTVVFGRQLMLEELLCATQALSIWALIRARDAARDTAGDAAGERPGPVRAWGALAGAAAGLAVLTKGLLGLVFPAIAALALTLEAGGLTRRALLRAAAPAALALIAVATPWHVAAALRHEGFVARYLLEEQVLRFFDARPHRDYRPVSLLAFLGFAALWLFPWAPFALESLRAPDRDARLIRVWALAVLGFFALTGARLEYYSLPALAPFAILIGRRFAREGASVPALAALAGVTVAGFAIAPVLLARWGQYVPHAAVPGIASGCVATLAAGAVAGLALALFGMRRASLAPIAAAGVIVAVLVGRGFAVYAPARSSAALAAAIAARAEPRDAVVLDAPGEWEEIGGLAWYLAPAPGASRPLVLNAAAKAVDGDARPFLIDEADLDRLAAVASASGSRVVLATRRPERYPGFRALASAGDRTILVAEAAP